MSDNLCEKIAWWNHPTHFRIVQTYDSQIENFQLTLTIAPKRPPEALPAPQKGEYPTGFFSTTTPLIESDIYFQGIFPRRRLNMMSSWLISLKMNWKQHSGWNFTFSTLNVYRPGCVSFLPRLWFVIQGFLMSMVRALFEWKLSGLVDFTFTDVNDFFLLLCPGDLKRSGRDIHWRRVEWDHQWCKWKYLKGWFGLHSYIL